MFNEATLTKKAKEFAYTYWRLNFDIPVNINSRLSISFGKYVYKELNDEHIPVRIDLSKHLIDNYKEETILSILKHEVCHWAFAVMGRNFSDGNLRFENELKRIGSSSTHSIELAGEIHIGACKGCERQVIEGPTKGSITRYERPNSRYVSKCCKERVVYFGTIYREDTNVIEYNKRLSSASSKIKMKREML